MTPPLLRRGAYILAAALALVYVLYVLVLKFTSQVTTGPLGEVGEFCLVLASVTCFSIGLFADEAIRGIDPH